MFLIIYMKKKNLLLKKKILVQQNLNINMIVTTYLMKMMKLEVKKLVHSLKKRRNY